MSGSKVIGLMMAVCAAFLFVFVLHRAYENHVTDEFKRIMGAATDTYESLNEQHAYLHDARLVVKTERDQQVLEEFEQASDLLSQGMDASSEVMRGFNDLTEEVNAQSQSITAQRRAPYADTVVIDKEVLDIQTKGRARIADLTRDRQHANEKYLKAVVLFRKVRSELGMPPDSQGLDEIYRIAQGSH